MNITDIKKWKIEDLFNKSDISNVSPEDRRLFLTIFENQHKFFATLWVASAALIFSLISLVVVYISIGDILGKAVFFIILIVASIGIFILYREFVKTKGNIEENFKKVFFEHFSLKIKNGLIFLYSKKK